MSKKSKIRCGGLIYLMFVVLVLGLAQSGWGAVNIIIVTDIDEDEAGYETFLKGILGDDTTVEIEAEWYRGLNDGDKARLEAADLIIVGRQTDSGQYDDGDEETYWNGLATPILNHSAFMTRSNRWKWLQGDQHDAPGLTHVAVVDVGNPIFDGVTIINGQVQIFSSAMNNIDVSTQASAGNGTLIATPAGVTDVMIACWDAGTEYYSGSGQTAGGQRIAFLMKRPRQFFPTLTADGKKMLENAILILLGLSTDPAMTSEPNPANEATDVPRDMILSWQLGEYAPPINGHTVYLSESFNDVNDGIGGVTQDANSYARPQRLDFSTTYYWRVDEVNGPPDYTVHEGSVWSFTTELLAYAIENITATASSTSQEGMGPENTINGSGLDANDLHSTEPTDMWLSSNEPNGAWIEYELDKVYKLHEMWVWNSNQVMEPMFGLGFKDVSIEYSVNGTDYTTLAGVPEFAQASGASDYAHNTTVDLGGAAARYVRLTANSNWGSMDRYGLSEVRFFSIPVFAREPSPDSGTTDVAVDVTLGFRAGRDAVTHDVYFNSDEQSVIDGNAPVITVTETSYGPLSLDLGTTYYWKINEVNEAETTTTWQGDIWNFSTHEYFIVDDFEDYNDWPPDEIWFTWVDGYGDPTNGATVGYPDPDWNQGEHYIETAIVHGGDQSMPLFYSNTGGAVYSEGKRTFAVPQNWIEAGVRTLALYFHGTAGNTGQLYAKVNDTKVPYDGQASNLALTGWQAWNIELASFGTGLQSVTTLAIGIDDNGASGTLYFDDIRLYSYNRQFITPAEPNNAGLIGHWKFDGDTLDSSGLGNDGTGVGDPTFVAGKVGSNALDLDGDDFVVIDAVADDFTDNDITLSAWVNTTDSGADWFSCNTGSSGNQVRLAIEGGKFGFDTDSEHALSTTTVSDGEWHLLTFVRSGNTGYTYVDGVMENSFEPAANNTSDFVASDLWSIGQEWDSGGPSGFLTGIVDDARIYDYALSLGEVAWLAGRTEPFDKPF